MSNAFDRSKNVLKGVSLLSKAKLIRSTSSNAASSVECSALKPYWLSLKNIMLNEKITNLVIDYFFDKFGNRR